VKNKPFDRYAYYKRAVQSPEIDCKFVSDAYKELKGKRPHDIREDFCGTFAICCEWVRRNRDNHAIGVDIDLEPIAYGQEHYLTKLRPEQQSRIQIVQNSVMTVKARPVDAVLAFNFSFYLFKSRLMLKRYFQRARRGLRHDGLLIVDCFGGKDCQEANQEETKFSGFKYYWDQVSFNPVTHEADFHIHFKRPGERRREKVFSYNWRMWTIPEIREAMVEAGFKRTHVYWEGSTRSGEGNGVFKRSEKGDECDGWVAYVIGES
jgi:cyclopropane fatty-acyl-phospholipid synthase-like methyltransferase